MYLSSSFAFIAARASTIVTELEIRTKVFSVASGTPIIVRGGITIVGLPLRRIT